jgi:TonB family protein
MIKSLLVLMLGMIMLQSAQAQTATSPKDTLVYCLSYTGEITSDKKNADHFLFIMPLDSSSGKKVYPINEYYANHKLKLLSSSSTKAYDKLVFEGACIEFYDNGKKKSIINYENGELVGNVTLYYPNGKLYAIENYDRSGQVKLIESRDSTGNVLCENGSGKWIKYLNGFKTELEEGTVKDSLEDGEWREQYYPSESYVTIYSKGEIISSTDPERPVGGIIYNYNNLDVLPEYKGGMLNFYRFLGVTIHYPIDAKTNTLQGKVLITLVVKKDGALTDIKVLKSPDKSLSDEALRAVKLSLPWTPGSHGGKPVLVQYTVPISFTLSSE